MSQLYGLKLVLLIVSFRGYLISADDETIPVDDTRIFFIHGPKYEDHTAYTLYEAEALAQDPAFTGKYTTLHIPDLLVTQYSTYHPIPEAYSTLSDVNFLEVDWGYNATDESDAKHPDEDKLKPLLADFIIELLNHIERKSFHFMSYSRAVPLAASVAWDYAAKTGTKLPRLTLLDPPTSPQKIENRLKGIDDYSAEFIDCIHTAPFKQGTILSGGHANFWPNGAGMQPGCTEESDEGPKGCSHLRSGLLFAESVRNRDSGPQFCSYGLMNFITLFQRKSLGKPVFMGINCDTSARGDYFLVTKASSPYALEFCPNTDVQL